MEDSTSLVGPNRFRVTSRLGTEAGGGETMLTCPASRDRTSRGEQETHAGSVAALISRDHRYDAHLNWQVMRFKIAT
jgi:hypothetical protein